MQSVKAILHGARYVSLLALLLLLSPSSAAAAAQTFQELALDIVEIIDTATITLIVFALVVYFWGMAVNIPHFGG